MTNNEPKSKFLIFLSALILSRASVGIYAKVCVLAILMFFVGQYGAFIEKTQLFPTIVHLVFVYLSLDIFFGITAFTINFFYRKKNRHSSKYVDSFTIGIVRLSNFFFWVIFLLFVVDVFISIKTLLTSITVTIAVMGLAFRDYITNFINGVNIMFSGKFQLGEYVQIGETKGKIKDLTFTHVYLLTETQDVVFVPNNLVLSKEVINYSKNRGKHIFVNMTVEKAHYEYYKELRQYIVSKVSEKFDDVLLDKNNIKIRVESLEKDSMKWVIEYSVSRYDFVLETALKDHTAEVVVDFFNLKEEEEKEEKKKEKESA